MCIRDSGMNDLYTLVIVIPYTVELLIESDELGIIFLRFLINLHHLELSAEDTGEEDVYKRQLLLSYQAQCQ